MDKSRGHGSTAESYGWFRRSFGRLRIDRRINVAQRHTALSDKPLPESEDFKGPLGLQLLRTVSEPLVDFIFIHGLGGGSRKTWSKSPDPYHYWPKEWLSQDPEFNSVRIYSFGYKADWAEKTASILNIHDFALSLLGEIKCNPDIRRSNSIPCPVPSVSGLTIPHAYILAREDPTLKEIAARIHTLYFLATPHRGSDLATTLANVLRVSFGPKPFVLELERNSDSIQSINDSFRHVADYLHIWSFYETLPCSFKLTSAIIVDKTSATLGYSKERCSLLNADHRGVCKFDSPADPNYKTVRNAFVTTIDSIVSQDSEDAKAALEKLSKLTGISDAPNNDRLALDELRTTGTCEWLTMRKQYASWKLGDSDRAIFWLTGNAGSGKSVISSSIIDDCVQSNLPCSYFFFKHGDRDNSTITKCLLSLAFQLCQMDKKILGQLTKVSPDSSTWEQLDERTLWREIFMEFIFKELKPTSRYWVIDALDECLKPYLLVSLLTECPPWLRIFVTSRNGLKMSRCHPSHYHTIGEYTLQPQDTIDDLRTFVNSRFQYLPIAADDDQGSFQAKILDLANGSFLWLSLVIRELETTFSEESAEKVISETPMEMHNVYTRILQNIPAQSHDLVRSIFTWTSLAMRPLSVEELKHAIKIDTGETVHRLEDAINTNCGQLIRVGRGNEVQCVHQTARAFLLEQEEISSFVIHRPTSQLRIAELCLKALSNFIDNAPGRRGSDARSLPITAESNIADYAAIYFSDHLNDCAIGDPSIWDSLLKFMECTALPWIQYLAETRRLQYVTHTGRNMASYLAYNSEKMPISSEKKKQLRKWIHDLLRVNAKFRVALDTCPSAIHTVIPSLCPPESIISRQYTLRPRGIILKGLEDDGWSECMSRIDYGSSRTTAIAHGNSHFAVSLSDGSITLYLWESLETKAIFTHEERVTLLKFSDDDQYLASSGRRKIKVWDLQTLRQVRTYDVSHQPLTVTFHENSSVLVAATRGNYITSWTLEDEKSSGDTLPWTQRFQEVTGQTKPTQPPAMALLSNGGSYLAVSYKGRPVYVFEMTTSSLVQACYRNSNMAIEYTVDGMVFNRNHNLLVVSYGDGELVVYDLYTAELCYRRQNVYAHTLACSPDGRNLVTGSSSGTLSIYEFTGAQGTSLALIHRINSSEDGIRGISFSADSLRFADIRGSQCRVWGPEIMIGGEHEDHSESDFSQARTLETTSNHVERAADVQITAICPHPDGRYLFCGKEDGSVMCFDGQTVQPKEVCRHALGIRISCMGYCKSAGLLVTADESSRILVSKIEPSSDGDELITTVSEIRSEEPVLDLLFNASGTKVLIEGRHWVKVWTLSENKVDFRLRLDDFSHDHEILQHPQHPDSFLVLGAGQAYMYMWDRFEETTGEKCLEKKPPNDDRNDCIAPRLDTLNQFRRPMSAGQYIATIGEKYASKKDPHPKLRVWEATEIHPDNKWPNEYPLPDFEHISSKIYQIIGVSGGLILFVDSDFWVCTVDLAQWKTNRQGAWRHFLLLSEWKGNSAKFLIEYLPCTREFMVVQRHNVLVIKRGLDVAVPLKWPAALCSVTSE
ncbi:WD40 repeat domain-containing protein [Aspergillus vadensis CBS 113365]|uniref:Uncharacterized protein n=1 Tax=Aspergillus vadensis (strain CBS 113365 / IMI 142717 / IBT 24658) TaxID=1448311 RepID=A0A319BC29_ASPVC|nr:hypothetical protein BO88DRAFT_462025 [Aspergillus vadensis CBS 113365]PYH69571.1 hypothetical protein BO88DRAFT_462025 [Aspergillus vadensis CBS 113365]